MGMNIQRWNLRPSTLDHAIFNDVVAMNEYRLPERFEPDDIVIDVGAHIGSFAHAAVSRGCEDVFSVEPDAANFDIASENLAAYIDAGLVRLKRAAVWRSDPNDDHLLFDGYHPFPRSRVELAGVINTGGGSVIWGCGVPVEKIALDAIMDLVTDNGERRVRLLKLDCEGAEWPILMTSRRLDLVDEIRGEFHEIGGQYLEIGEGRHPLRPVFPSRPASLTIELLTALLNEAGFETVHQRHRRPDGVPEGLGLFFARRVG